MANRPLLLLPSPEPVGPKRGRGFPPPPKPVRGEQAQRLARQFADIQRSYITATAGDIERILVMETSAPINDLEKASRKIPGMEWVAELELDPEDFAQHGLYDKANAEKIKHPRLYMWASNRQATDALLGLWQRFDNNERLPRGYGAFQGLFKCLTTLRRWNIRDRLSETGILDAWRRDLADNAETSSTRRFEIELHFRSKPDKRAHAQSEIIKEIEDAQGQIIGKPICLAEIAFHALKAELPISKVASVVQPFGEMQIPACRNEAVRYVRPCGQHSDALRSGTVPCAFTPKPPGDKPAAVALLDGVPLLEHALLDKRINYYDPDGFTSAYEPYQRKHGTSMASLICHGQLKRPATKINSLSRRIYARPVLTPSCGGAENIPFERFQEDLIHRAVLEMFTGDKPAAPNIKVINLSLGNQEQLYLHEMSPWARLLDWLSYEHNVLFIVSAGNYSDSIKLAEGQTMTDRVIRSIDNNQRQHRLLSPAESLNALTVGALQSDASDSDKIPSGFDPIVNADTPAPYSRIGPGYHGAIKPELLVSGGRQLYSQKPSDEKILVPAAAVTTAPGVQVAQPGTGPALNNTGYVHGTSCAAAVATHHAGHIYEVLEELREQGHNLHTVFDAVMIKALLAHSATREQASRAYDCLEPNKHYISRYVGYGAINADRVMQCTQHRVTALGCGTINVDSRHKFTLPLPDDLLHTDHIGLPATLAWLTPINPRHFNLRKARLHFELDQEDPVWRRRSCVAKKIQCS